MKELLSVKPFRKALAAFAGGGGTALAATLPGGLTVGEFWAVLAAAVGASVATWWAPPNVPNYPDTPQDTA